MRFGYFDDERREYVVTTPITPSPWINYLGDGDFVSLISHTGGGYCFHRDARLRRILRYRYNDVPRDGSGRHFYVHEEGQKLWSPGFMPMRTPLDRYECRHGLGYTRITGERKGLSVSTEFLVPVGVDAELQRVTVRNRSDRPRTIKLFSYLEFCLWNALDDATNLQRNLSTGEVEVEPGTIYHVTEYRERRDHYAFHHVDAEPSGFDTDRERFVGPCGGLEAPQVPLSGSSGNSVASGWAPIASHSVALTLVPGEERALVFVLGYVENPPDAKWERPGVVDKRRARALIERWGHPAGFEEAAAQLREHWSQRLSLQRVESQDPAFDRMVNTWNPYQCMTTFNVARSASHYETGIGRGIGFRDSNQDILGAVHMAPARARQRLIDLASTQLADGSAYHQYQPLTKRGNHDIGGGFNDDPLWLILAVASYLKETGDRALLDERVPFDHDPSSARPMWEHLRRSFDHVIERLGPHSLPLIGRADWNDCLNLNCFSRTPDESFQTTGPSEGKVAESVMIAGMFVFIGREYAALARLRGETEEAERAEAAIARMEEAVLEHGHEGEWFLRAYDAFGSPIGSRECAEGRIFIESQGWCAMAEIGRERGLCERALDAVGEHLATPHGIVLHSPSYTRYREELGEISSYPPGYKENGGIFCHNNPWIMIAEAIHGRGDRALRYYKQLTPSYHAEGAALRRSEPYVYAQMVAGRDAPNFGQAKNSWLTGAAAWHLVAAVHYMLGVRPEHEGLRVRPTIAAELGPYTVQRRCRGSLYRIDVKHDSQPTGVQLEVDGVALEGELVPYAPPGSEVYVRCLVGALPSAS